MTTAAPAGTGKPIILRGMGAFYLPSRPLEIPGKPVLEVTFGQASAPAETAPNGSLQLEPMQVQHLLEASERNPHPLWMWHGDGLTGVPCKARPNGREGRESHNSTCTEAKLLRRPTV